ncbi:MAG: hypothetical protein AMXMBFR84_01900 [Candidatus Hydrogenedentota bacterium]
MSEPRTMRNNVLWFFAVVITALVQTTWLEAIRYQDVLPDLTVLLVIYFAMSQGIERAMLTGALGGLFQDVASNSVIGHHVLCLVIIGYVAGRIATRLMTEHPAVKVGLVFLAGVLNGLLYILIAYVQDPGRAALYNIIARVVPSSFYTALCTPILFFLLDRSFRSRFTLRRGTA